MSPLLLLPAALGALLALLLPLLIHLARREQQHPTLFAALRWLRERPKPRRRIRFDEWPLLLLRLLLLALLALWLARPALQGASDTTPWTVVAEGIPDEAVAALRGQQRGELRWLATGFPPLSEPPPGSSTRQPVASLLRELDARLPREASLTVLVPERLAGLDGAPVQLSRDVAWRVLPGESPLPASRDAPTMRLVIRHGDDREGVRYLRAAVLALSPDVDAGADAEANVENDVEADVDTERDAAADALDIAPAGTPLPEDAQRIAWLAPGPLPDDVLGWIERGGVALLAAEAEIAWPRERAVVTWRDPLGAPLVEEMGVGHGRVLRLLRPLRPADLPQVLAPQFPQRLQALFDAPPAPTLGDAHAAAPRQGGQAWLQAPRDLQPWLALLLALLVLVERWMATSRRREART